METKAEVVGDLMRSEAYPAPRPREIGFASTHASWVFLTEHEVWKVKRPVCFGFLDFRSAEARRHFCEEEVRLNRRLAPDVYLGVAPVYRGPRGLSFAGPGEVVDHAVRMRRLPAAASARDRLACGTLDRTLLAQLAARLAAFFQEAARADRFGALEVLRANVSENFAQVEPFVGTLVDRATFDDVRAFQERMLAAGGDGADRLAARVGAGRIRDGHGDLRLEHVYFLPEPLAIDCIEFNQRFRCGDVAGEIAFLDMELEAAGRADLGAGLVARFAELTDDFDLYGVLDFYLAYRAWVRGKVAAFLTADPLLAIDVKHAKAEEARRGFALARAVAAGAPLDPPFLIAVGGMIGSGKSTLAAALGDALAAPVVGSDRTRKALAGIASTAPGGPELYTDAFTARTYAELIRRARVVLSSGRSAILDATFGTRAARDRAAALARATAARFAFVEARCPEDVLRARLAARRPGAQVSDAGVQLYDQLRRRHQESAEIDPSRRLVVDTAGTPEAAATAALAGLARLQITHS
jgi:aminoglycoside phosphotransferase family enzyme/predicted kinase